MKGKKEIRIPSQKSCPGSAASERRIWAYVTGIESTQ